MKILNTLIILFLCCCINAAPHTAFTLSWDDDSVSQINLNSNKVKPVIERIKIKDGHFFKDDERIRFWGVNICSGAAFPTHEEADKVAARLAKFGVNCVRFHHMEAEWNKRNIFGVAPFKSSVKIDPESLDRLDYFIAQLKKYGIYANINILVSRTFHEKDSVPAEIAKLPWKDQHTVGFWNERLQEMQKDYAKQLLEHVNPYTKMSYIDDPIVAMVEINNENGLLHPFFTGKLHSLPQSFLNQLEERWNKFLAQKYKSDSDLKKQWHAVKSPVGKEILRPVKNWYLTKQMGADSKLTVAENIATAKVLKAGPSSWTVEFAQSGLKVKQNEIYTASFWVRSDSVRKTKVCVGLGESPWSSFGLDREIEITPEWQKFTLSFVSTQTSDNTRFIFKDLSQESAEFQFKDLSLKPGGTVSVPEDITLAKTIPLYGFGEMKNTPPAVRRDYVEFLYQLEEQYWDNMFGYLKKDLKCESIIIPTIVGVSTPRMMAKYGVIDTHGYWAHPSGETWKWKWNLASGKSMVQEKNAGVLANIAASRVVGLPFMLSEYNHCIPNLYAGETPIFLAAYASLQDWDAIFLFAYTGSGESIRHNSPQGCFNIAAHPGQMGHFPNAAAAFCDFRISPAKEWQTSCMEADTELDLLASVGAPWKSVNARDQGVDPRMTGIHKIGIALTPKDMPKQAKNSKVSDKVISDTEEVIWDTTTKGSEFLAVDTPNAIFLVGYKKDFEFKKSQINLSLEDKTWASVSLSLLEGDYFAKAQRVLLTAVGEVTNTGMIHNKEKDSCNTNWGKAPTLIEEIKGKVVVPANGKTVKVYALDEKGNRKTELEVKSNASSVEFFIGKNSTIWYEINWSNK